MKKLLSVFLLCVLLLCVGCGAEESYEKENPVISQESTAPAETEAESSHFSGTPLEEIAPTVEPGYIPEPEPVQPPTAER